MVAKNDITGDSIQTKGVSDTYRNNYDLIFGKKMKVEDNTDVTKNEFQDVLSTEEALTEYDEPLTRYNDETRHVKEKLSN